jgi:hypothetical protein
MMRVCAEDGAEKGPKYPSCFRFRRSAIYIRLLSKNMRACEGLLDKRREVVVGKIRAT